MQRDSLPAYRNKYYAVVYARNILIQADTIIYNEPILLPDEFPEKILNNHKNTYPIPEIDNNAILKIHPNPAKGYFIAEYQIIEGTNNSIDIVDVNGKIIKTIFLKDMQNQLIVETGDLKTGIYNIRLVVDGKVSKSLKLLIVKN